MSARLAPDFARFAADAPPPLDVDGLERLARARDGAPEESGLDEAVERLRAAGWLAACLPERHGGAGLASSADPSAVRATADALRALGRADLALARLWEGHANAVKLVALHASEPLRRLAFERVAGGALLGVWGAPGADPLRVAEVSGNEWTLAGAKAYASGLGLVELAIVTVADPDTGASRLLLVDVDDPERQDPGEWRASGMRATRSGDYRFDGVRVAPLRRLGGPGVYEREPWFQGGTWRYAAAHVGAMEALADETLRSLLARGREADPHQRARLGRAAALVAGARALVERAAVEVETVDPGHARAVAHAVALALLARELVEGHATELLALVERSLGMAAYERGARVERLRRDLGLYLRQAAPDAKLALAADTLAGEARDDAGDGARGLGALW